MASPPGLSRSRNLADLRSRAATLANLLPVTRRGPTGNDNGAGYVPGQSVWLDPDGQLSQLQSLMPTTGKAQWAPIANPGRHAGALIPGTIPAGTQRLVPGYAGTLFTAVRASDLATQAITALPDDSADLSTLAGFLAPTGGIGYVTSLNLQDGSGLTLSQTVLASMPLIDMATVVNGNLPLCMDSGHRDYWLTMGQLGGGTWAATWPGSGNIVNFSLVGASGTGSITGTTATLPALISNFSAGFWCAGQILSGAGVTAGTTLIAPIQTNDATGGGTWLISPSQTVVSTTLTASLPALPIDILPGDYVTGTNIAAAAFTATIAGTALTVVSLTSGTIAIGQLVQNAAAGTHIVSGSGTAWVVDVSQTIATTTAMVGTTTVAAVNYATGAVTLATTPLGTLGALTLHQPGCFLDLPSSVLFPWQTWGCILSAEMGVIGTSVRPFLFGAHGNDPLNGAASYSGVIFGAVATSLGFRLWNGNNVGSGSLPAPNGSGTYQSSPLVWAWSAGGVNGRDLTYQWDGVQGFTPNATAAVPASNLAGGSIGFNRQLINGTVNGVSGDFLLYDILLYPQSLTAAQIGMVSASLNAARGWFPQVQATLTADGSSTTAGNGTIGALCWPEQAGKRLSSVSPRLVYAAVSGGTIENSVGQFPNVGGMMPASKRGLLVWHPGLGNSLQQTGSFTSTGQTGSVLSVNTSNSILASIGTVLSGINLAAGTVITAWTGSSITVSPAPLGTVGAFTVLNDTAQIAWGSIVAYFAQAASSSFGPFVLEGSASRRSFTTGQLAAFNTIKTIMREGWQTLPGVVGFIDWEDDPYFGSDGASMVVQAISANQVTVQALSTYAGVGNRVRWSGMPYSIAGNSGGQTIAAISGNAITVSGATTGLSVGQIIQATSPCPWSAYPGRSGLGLNPDGQHFCKQGYWRQGDTVAQFLLDNSILG
jgi:hypothetical protein